MVRPRLNHLDGNRRTITLPLDLDELIAIQAARGRTTISLVIEGYIRAALAPPAASANSEEAEARIFPKEWEGQDLRKRLYALKMRQTDLAEALKVPTRRLNAWIRGSEKFPDGKFEQIIQILKSWDSTKSSFRWGSLSPAE